MGQETGFGPPSFFALVEDGVMADLIRHLYTYLLITKTSNYKLLYLYHRK